MRKILFILFVSVALFASAKVYTLYYGPDQNGKYYEMLIHGKEACLLVQQDSIARYSHRRVELFLRDQSPWYLKFVRFNEGDNTLVWKNTHSEPAKNNIILTADLSVLEIKNLRSDEGAPGKKLPLADIHIDPRAGKDDYIGDPKLKVRVLPRQAVDAEE